MYVVADKESFACRCCARYDLLHNAAHVEPFASRIYTIVSPLATLVVPQEFGITKEEKVFFDSLSVVLDRHRSRRKLLFFCAYRPVSAVVALNSIGQHWEAHLQKLAFEDCGGSQICESEYDQRSTRTAESISVAA